MTVSRYHQWSGVRRTGGTAGREQNRCFRLTLPCRKPVFTERRGIRVQADVYQFLDRQRRFFGRLRNRSIWERIENNDAVRLYTARGGCFSDGREDLLLDKEQGRLRRAELERELFCCEGGVRGADWS